MKVCHQTNVFIGEKKYYSGKDLSSLSVSCDVKTYFEDENAMP